MEDKMNNTEDTHGLTENIYKNLATKFNPQAKAILCNGKAYHRALLTTSAAARSYIESLGRLGHECRTSSKGGTEEIGQAIFRIAEVYKDIQMKFEDCTKALFAEIILPLEQKLENEFKNAGAEQRKYHQGHKEFLVPYQKAAASLEKFKKKNKAKGLYDEEKEAPFTRAMLMYRDKLDEFRIQGLKLAMLEERKCYCFILSHLASVATVQLHYHDRGLDGLTDDLATWRQMSSQPHVLPRSADAFLRMINTRPEHMNGGLGMGYSYTAAELGVGHQSPYRQLGHNQADYQYSLPPQISPSETLQRRQQMPSVPPQGPQVKALYPHIPTQEGQLNFNVGDTMTLIGEPADGWNYGYNPINDQYGWVPLAYIESAPRNHPPNTGLPPRAKSISDLKEHSLAALSASFTFDSGGSGVNIPGTTKRPKSLHEPALIKMVSEAFHPSPSETSSVNSASTISSQVVSQAYTSHNRPPLDTVVYQAIPGESMDMHSMGQSGIISGPIFSADGQPLRNTGPAGGQFIPPSPPLPPPPMTSAHNFAPTPHQMVSGSATTPNTPMMSSRPRSNSIGTYLPHAMAPPIFSIPPPPSLAAPLPPTSIPPPPPASAIRPIPPPVSQKTTTPMSSMMTYAQPPPPPPPPPPAPTLKDEITRKSLRKSKSKTNDRSAPAIR